MKSCACRARSAAWTTPSAASTATSTCAPTSTCCSARRSRRTSACCSRAALSPTYLQQTFGAAQPANTGDFDRYRQDDDTFAVFTNDTFHITSKLEFNAGFRFTHDDKTLNSVQTNTGGGALSAAR